MPSGSPRGLAEHPAALVAAARWALELTDVEDCATAARLPRAAVALEHGLALARALPEADRRALAAALPADLGGPVETRQPLSLAALRALPEVVTAPWAARLAAGLDEAGTEQAAPGPLPELARPLEDILVAGGDNRLTIDAARGLNRYGTAPRPRPEAIHFSSSTASSISDYGFRLCDELRRRVLRRGLAGAVPEEVLRADLADRVRDEIAALLGLEPYQADVVLAASGTDTELLAVLLALAADDGRPLTNLLVAPEETGRGVVLAGEGRWFDDVAATGVRVRKGEPAWPGRAIETRAVAIRDTGGRVRPAETIAVEIRQQVNEALERGHRVLLHVVLGSKTGISAPPLEVAEGLRRAGEGRVDVVVDACQLRVTPSLLGALARRGWMVQVSGSKFLTGPAFSGALVVPPALRDRRAAAARLLAAAPAVAWPSDWPAEWRAAFGEPDLPPASFGPLLRWAAALGEACLLNAVPRTMYRAAFERFRTALHDRLEASRVLVSLPTPDRHLADLGEEPPGLSARSIICFALAVGGTPEAPRLAGPEECQLLFEMLNRDVSGLLPGLTPEERRLAARPMHIGQPVALRPDSPEAPTVLRLVVGARYFTIVGYPADGDTEASLAAEIADATSALDKLELLVRHFGHLRKAA